MFLSSDIQKYKVFLEHSLLEVLKKISENKSRVVFVVSESGKLLGSISDGDVRRWITKTGELDISIEAQEIMNTRVKRVFSGFKRNEVIDLFKNGVDIVPVVDGAGHLTQVVFDRELGFCISDKEISQSSPCYIIAEIGNNHQGDINLAKELVDHAVNAGVDCVKFQMRNMEKLYKNSGDANDNSADLGAQYTLDLLSRFQLEDDELFEVFDYVKSKNVEPLCTPWDLISLQKLEVYGMKAYKVASADFTNYELLEAIAKTGKPFFCSTGMSSEMEIRETVYFLDQLSANYVLLHCNSTYPTPFKDVNLNYLTRLRKITGQLVGYSGHERGIAIPIASIPLGGKVVEKHLTIDVTLEGTDHKVSLLPGELTRMVRDIRNVEESLGGENSARVITQGEMINRENLAKSLVANTDIRIGQLITRDMIEIKSPGQGIQPNMMNDLVGKSANREIKEGDFFHLTDIHGQVVKKNYKFSRPFGVPVRYHDYDKIKEGTNLDFVEFHLSYKDMELKLDDCFSGVQPIGFAVHSPELFQGDHILDLASYDEDYRQQSVTLLQDVISITRKLKRFFPRTKKPVIVVNAGGWNSKGFLTEEDKKKKYQVVEKSLSELDLDGIVIAIQTMPPFPWHFGGQSFHNLFVDANEIKDFCERNDKIKICLDISHSMMACNYYGWDLYEFVEIVAPYNTHMHIVDAKGIDGEGVEIGKGDVDFNRLMNLLELKNSGVQFIPEVWQGHKNSGEGFWRALEFLESIEIE